MYFNAKGRGGRRKTPEYKAWIELAGYQLNTQHARKFNGRVSISIDLDERRRGDADNRAKAVLDFLVKRGVIPNDSNKWVKRVSIGWEPIDDCLVHIEQVEHD